MATPTSLRVVEAQARRYRHTWRSSVFSSFVNPALQLLAMGVGLGALVDQRGGPAGLPYLAWLAPGLLAAGAMMTAAGESSYPVMAGVKWIKSYHAALSTPLSTRDLVAGHLGWATIRVVQVSVVFAVVMALFGATGLGPGLVAVVPATLTGLAFAAPITAYTARLEHEAGLASLFRFGIVPLFLFSGTFFPISQLPDPIEPLAWLTPLWHGVELARAAALGLDPAWPWWGHIAVLAAAAALGALAADRFLRQRLVT